MKLYGIGKTDKGLFRDNNEDNIYVDGRFVSDVSCPSALFYSEVNRENHTFAVCDGIGGSDCGEIASLTAVMALSGYESQKEFDLNDCINALNSAVLVEKNKRRIRGMGSTIALIHNVGESLYYANVGDSRIYLVEGGELRQLSKDHTRNQMLLDAGVENKNVQKQYEHQLTQNLGISEDDFVIDPALGRIALKYNSIVMLCSDGVTDVINDERLSKIISDNKTNTPEEILNAIFNEAIEKKTKDNISIIIIKVE